MLLKLIKYDLKSTYAKILLTFLVFVLICIVAPLLLVQFQKPAAFVYVGITGGLGCVAMYVLMMVFLFQRYNSNFYSSEGYLMFSLPTDGKRLLTSKLLVAVIWFVLGSALIICGVSTLIYVFSFEPKLAKLFTQLFKELFGSLEINLDTVSCTLVSGLLSTILCILEIYFAISVSKLPLWGKCGVLMGFVTYFVVNVLQSLPNLLIYGIGAYNREFTTGFMTGFTSGLNGVKYSTGDDKIAIGHVISAAYSWKYEWGTLLIATVFCALLFLAITWLLNRKTSLK